MMRRNSPLVIASIAAVGVLLGLFAEFRATAASREALETFHKLVEAGNAGDVEFAKTLCSKRRLETSPPNPAREGGLIGVPRMIHPNFSVWKEGENLRICSGNREGAVYQFVKEGGDWKFDGLVGVLKGGVTIPVSSPEP